jgi:ectoine hydroxylase-related dioxygenase (phytanoyl-CoA dioxygenase family)
MQARLKKIQSQVDPEAVRFYREEGYVLLPGLFGANTVCRLREAAATVAAAGAELRSDTTLRGVRYIVQSATGRMNAEAVQAGVFRKIMFPHKDNSVFQSFKGDERIREALRLLGVGSPICVLDQINLKVAEIGTGFPWHQDAHFLAPPHQASILNHGGANLVIALDEADASNGAFEVLAGSHAQGPLTFAYDTGSCNDGLFDESRRALIAMQPGDAVFFHPYLLHGSAANRSEKPRCLLTYWFVNEPVSM